MQSLSCLLRAAALPLDSILRILLRCHFVVTMAKNNDGIEAAPGNEPSSASISSHSTEPVLEEDFINRRPDITPWIHVSVGVHVPGTYLANFSI